MALKQLFSWLTGDDSQEPDDSDAPEQESPAMRAMIERTRGLAPVSDDSANLKSDESSEAFFSEARSEIDRMRNEFTKEGVTFGRRMPLPPELLDTAIPQVHETPTEYTVRLRLPGFTQKDVKVEVHDSDLLLSAEHRTGRIEGEWNNRFKSQMINSFRHKIKLAGNINPDNVTSSLEDGVLLVTVRKN